MRWGIDVNRVLVWLLFGLFSMGVDAAYVINNSGRKIAGKTISATADGSVTLTTATGQTMTFRRGQYRAAVTDRPIELEQAERFLKEGRGGQAVLLLKKVKADCCFLAWDQKAILLLANYYFENGQFAEAAAEFQALHEQSDPAIQAKIREALIQSGQTDDLVKALERDVSAGSREAAARAYILLGDLKAAKGDLAGARCDWLKVTLFFKRQQEQVDQANQKLNSHKML